jgi:hypothetical protein
LRYSKQNYGEEMKLHIKTEKIKSIAERFRSTYCFNGKWTPCYFGIEQTHSANYELLKKASAEAEIEAIIGNKSWTRNSCSECGKDFDVVIEIGQPEDYESATAYLCASCLGKALGLAQGHGEGMTRQDLEKDILILVLRLMGENLNTFSEEVSEVMARWKSKAHAVLRGEHVYDL